MDVSKRDELQAVLSPWGTLRDDVDWTQCPEKIWEQLMEQAPKIAAISQYWFLKGIQRSIDEMERKVDGKPFWLTRQELIDHLKSINAPH